MNLKTPINILKNPVLRAAVTPHRWARPLGLFFWLAGARRATLDHLPESERERVAVLGSSVLVPTLLAFFGMYLYASSRFATPRPVVSVLLALAWAFVVMQVDRILLATYRPFQPRRRRAFQICFRVGLAAVISVAIAFPFCLEQYRGAITQRLQTEFRGRLHELQQKERADRELIEGRDQTRLAALRTQLDQERAAGPADPKLYAEELAKKEQHRQADNWQERKRQLEQEAAAAKGEWQQVSVRIREVEQDRKEEARGRLGADRGGTGKSGQGAKFQELSRELELLGRAEQSARQRYDQLLTRAAAVRSVDPPQDALTGLDADKRASLLAEAEGRKQRLEQLVREVARLETEQADLLAGHKLRYQPVLASLRAKAEGRFDPMEETIGLFKVIFTADPEIDGTDRIVRQYKWIAALFQFAIVFGTLFLLDLIAILSKVMSRPGPYDVLVEFPELVARENLAALEKEYARYAGAWAKAPGRGAGQEGTGQGPEPGIDLRRHEELAGLLFRAHLPAKDDTAPPGRDR